MRNLLETLYFRGESLLVIGSNFWTSTFLFLWFQPSASCEQSDADSVYSRYTTRSRSSTVSEYRGSAPYRAQTGNTKGLRQGGLRRSTSSLSEASVGGLRRSSSSRDLSRDYSNSPREAYYVRQRALTKAETISFTVEVFDGTVVL